MRQCSGLGGAGVRTKVAGSSSVSTANNGKTEIPPNFSGRNSSGSAEGSSALTDMPPVFGVTIPSESGLISFGTRTPSRVAVSPHSGRPDASARNVLYTVRLRPVLTRQPYHRCGRQRARDVALSPTYSALFFFAFSTRDSLDRIRWQTSHALAIDWSY